VALAGRVIASHYAKSVDRQIAVQTQLRSVPADDGEVVGELGPGELFAMLDDSLGWAWGYAGEDRRVGYVHLSTIKAS
jgi:Bacterial dipeptidyl-peptidase Sh3 domain